MSMTKKKGGAAGMSGDWHLITTNMIRKLVFFFNKHFCYWRPFNTIKSHFNWISKYQQHLILQTAKRMIGKVSTPTKQYSPLSFCTPLTLTIIRILELKIYDDMSVTFIIQKERQSVVCSLNANNIVVISHFCNLFI